MRRQAKGSIPNIAEGEEGVTEQREAYSQEKGVTEQEEAYPQERCDRTEGSIPKGGGGSRVETGVPRRRE